MRARFWWFGLFFLVLGSSVGCEGIHWREEQKERWCREHGFCPTQQQCCPQQYANPCAPNYYAPAPQSSFIPPPYNNGCR
jgi:hypothetical protein